MRGWMAYLGRARTIAAQFDAYGRLLQHLNNYREIALLAFDEVAAAEFQRLKKLRPRLAAMDLKIAAIVLSNNATLLTRNRQDFGQIPDLKIEDWTA
jgi:tRNA(fMet)-specific endonuclease VapC